MKKLLVLLTIIVVVASAFTNVALATETPHYVYVHIDQDFFNYGTDIGKATITGRILSDETNSLISEDTFIYIYKDNGDGEFNTEDIRIAQTSASNGEFSTTIITNSDDTGIGQYWVMGEDVGNIKFDILRSSYAEFTIMYDIKLTDPSSLEWEYPVIEPVEIAGEFINKNGQEEHEIYLAYINESGEIDPKDEFIALASFQDNETFGFLFDGEEFRHTGEIGLYVGGVLALKGEIKPQELDAEITNKVKRFIDDVFTFKFNLDKMYLNSDNNCLADGYTIHFRFFSPNGDYLENYTLLDSNANKFTRFDVLEKDIELKTNSSTPLGEWQVIVSLYKSYSDSKKYVIAEKELEFDIVNPKKYNLVYWDLENHKVGDITFYTPEADIPDDQPDMQIISVAKYIIEEEPVIEFCKYFEVTIEGCGIEESFKTFDENGLKTIGDEYTGTFQVSPDQTGELSVTIDVFTDENDNSPNYSVTKIIDIVGWNINIEPKEVVTGYEGDVKITITDENDLPINHALIEINEIVVADGTTESIKNGLYTISDTTGELFDQVQPLKVRFWTTTGYNNEEQPEVSKENGIEVVGESVYSVSSQPYSLLNGIKETILIKTVDENGDIIYPNYWRIDIDEDGKKSEPLYIEVEYLGDFIDSDNDGRNDSREITIIPNSNQKALIIRATTDYLKKMGETEISVQKPQAIMTGVQAITENFKSLVKFKLVDPRDNSELDVSFDIVDKNAYFNWVSDDDFAIEDGFYTLEILVCDVNWDEAKADDETVALRLEILGDDGEEVAVLDIPIKQATLTSDPSYIMMSGSTNLTLTYLDAEGKPIVGKQIYFFEDSLSETDENGQITHAISSSVSLSFSFSAETDCEYEYTQLMVKSIPDIQPPTASIELLDSNIAIVTIKDNVRLNKSMVNGKEVDMYFPLPEVTYIVDNLVPGENEVHVLSVDLNNNILDTVLTVFVEDNNSITIKIGEATAYGTPVLQGDTTMVPVRLAENLGATVLWDNETQTVIYTLKDNSISLTIGSETAIVNGENKLLPAVPYINNQDRAMVPLRMIAQELGFEVIWISNQEPIRIK